MSAMGQELRCQLRDLLILRAWRSDELARLLGVNEGTVCHAIRDLQDDGIPVSEWGWDMYRVAYPKGRECTVCGAILSQYNPCDVCNCHGGGHFPPYVPAMREVAIVCPHCHEKTQDYLDGARRCRACVQKYGKSRRQTANVV